jgi:chromosome segregation ATPase
METEQLKQSLKSLHAALESAGPMDAELQNLLRTLDGDIRQLLAQREAGDADEEPAGGLAERSQEIGARFAARHPQLEPTLRELGNILANMGI